MLFSGYTLQKWGGISAIILATTYIFGMILFFGVLDSSDYEEPKRKLEFLIENRDLFFLGYVVIGIIFSFALIVLVLATYRKFKQYSPELMSYNTVVGHIWACIVLAAYMISLVSINAVVTYYPEDSDMTLTIYRSLNVITNALGGGIELIGAIWVLIISYIGLKSKVYSAWLHYWGLIVASAGVLTLFSGLSFLSSNPVFEVMTAIFGLGQIFWFIGLGVALFNDRANSKKGTVENKP